jgi:glycine/D-amino acid oxidase-like deaminating enzyme
MQAPAIGRIVAESVLGVGNDPALSVFDARRFAEGRPVPEPSVV